MHGSNDRSRICRITVGIGKIGRRKRKIFCFLKISIPEPNADGDDPAIDDSIVGCGVLDTPAFIDRAEISLPASLQPQPSR